MPKPFDPLNADDQFVQPKLTRSDVNGALAGVSAAAERKAPAAPIQPIYRPPGAVPAVGAVASPATSVTTPTITTPASPIQRTYAPPGSDVAPQLGLAGRIGQAVSGAIPSVKRAVAGAVDIGTYPTRSVANTVADAVTGFQGGTPGGPAPLFRPPAAASVAPPPIGTLADPTVARVVPPASVAATPATSAIAPVTRGVPVPNASPAANTFNGQPVADLLKNPRNPINVIPSGQSPIARPGTASPVLTREAPKMFNMANVTPSSTQDRELNPFSADAISKANHNSEMQYTRMTDTDRAGRVAEYAAKHGFADSQQAAANANAAALADTALREQAATKRSAATDARELTRTSMDNQSALELAGVASPTLTDASGTVFTRRGATATPVTTTGGLPVRAAPPAIDTKAQQAVLKALSEQRTALLQPGMDAASQKLALDAFDKSLAGQQLAQLTQKMTGGAAAEPPVPGAQQAPDGKWYVRHEDGSYSVVGQ